MRRALLKLGRKTEARPSMEPRLSASQADWEPRAGQEARRLRFAQPRGRLALISGVSGSSAQRCSGIENKKPPIVFSLNSFP